MSQENRNREEQGIRILEALSGVDEELLARCEEAGGKSVGKNSGKILSFWQRYGKLCAACLCLVFLGTAFWGISLTQKDSAPSEAAGTNYAFKDAAPQAEMSLAAARAEDAEAECFAEEETAADQFAGNTAEDKSDNAGNLGAVGLTNPLTELTEEDFRTQYGIAVTLPETVGDVTYWTINGADMIYECRFIDDLAEQKANMIAPATKEQESRQAEVRLRICRTDEAEDISGMYYTWTDMDEVTTEEGDCQVALTEEGQGICIWYKDGYSFAVSMTEGASKNQLLAYRETIVETIVLP